MNCNSRGRQTEQHLRTGSPCGQEHGSPCGAGTGTWASSRGRDGSRAPRTPHRLLYVSAALPLKTTHTQSSASTWDRESKTLMDTHNRTVQRLQPAGRGRVSLTYCRQHCFSYQLPFSFSCQFFGCVLIKDNKCNKGSEGTTAIKWDLNCKILF